MKFYIIIFNYRLLNNFPSINSDIKSWLAGCWGGLAASIFSCSSDLLKIRSQNNTIFSTNYMQLTSGMIAHHGYSSLLRGYQWTLLRDVPGYAVYFGFYEVSMKYIMTYNCSNAKSLRQNSYYKYLTIQVFCAIFASIGSWMTVYPFDIVKSIIQDSESNLTIREVFKKYYYRYGAKFFFRGSWATILSAIPSEATWLLIYEETRSLL